MKTLSLKMMAVALCCGSVALAQTDSLMAWYPLNCTANDTTGHFLPMTLTNTPFVAGGGIYCSGVCISSGLPDACLAETPAMPTTMFRAFTVTVEFTIDTFPAFARPVIIGGNSYRWMAFNVAHDGAVELLYNNSQSVTGSLYCRLGTWHTATMTYDSAAGTGSLSLDGAHACTAAFTIVHGTSVYDHTFGVSNYGNATTFKGTLRNLRIYSTYLVPTGIGAPDATAPSHVSLRSFPEPFSTSVTLECTLPAAARAAITIHDVLGREVAVAFDRDLPAGVHAVAWNAGSLPSGLYFARMSAGAASATKSLLLRR